MGVSKLTISIILRGVISLLVFCTGCKAILTPGPDSPIIDVPSVTASGNLETRELDYSGFIKLNVGYGFQAEVTKADIFSLNITLDDNLFEYIDIKKHGGTLYIGMDPNHSYDGTRKIIITMPVLKKLELSGASEGYVRGFSSAYSLHFELSGASSLAIDDIEVGYTSFNISEASVVAGNMRINDGDFDISGASRVKVKGIAANLTIAASDASNVKLDKFAAIDVTIYLSGASYAAVNASGTLNVDLSDSSNLSYIGSPTISHKSISKASTISQK